MATLQLPKFQSHPECAVSVMTLEDAQFLIAQGWLSVEGACYLFPQDKWSMLSPLCQN